MFEGNGVIDSLTGLNPTDGPFSWTMAIEAAIRGVIEYEGTNLRMYYTANEAPGQRYVHGTYSVARLGYKEQSTSLVLILPCLLFFLTAAACYT
jgi:hypothetical protein